ncbi:hypothetical protein KGQ19_41860 [Catenulispora sp. NL8]|uniref:Uncharacterized protein n=1 Tax=Catenulispora pinistramenti TaxID=2705254 RepID=A0ABS5L5A2_9ACTN|nr:hypothetical protein [Catenulispora pinistramenti]MBS2553420.1 hypothetical protein [Catenulispora pinistramenti]
MSTIEATTTTVELPVEFDPRWNRMPGITVEGRQITVDPEQYFFRFDSNTWRLCDWDRVAGDLLGVAETSEKALDQTVLEFIQHHGYSTSDAAKVLATAWQVNNYMFREDHLGGLGIAGFTADHLRMLREVGTFMALNKVEDDGTISNVGPCWMLPAATTVVFDLTDQEAEMVDEVYHGAWFNEERRLEALKANAALGGRLVHGCQSVPSQSGGAIVPFGASITRFYDELRAFRGEWLERVRSMKPTTA